MKVTPKRLVRLEVNEDHFRNLPSAKMQLTAILAKPFF
jgi:hypothetical protein